MKNFLMFVLLLSVSPSVFAMDIGGKDTGIGARAKKVKASAPSKKFEEPSLDPRIHSVFGSKQDVTDPLSCFHACLRGVDSPLNKQIDKIIRDDLDLKNVIVQNSHLIESIALWIGFKRSDFYTKGVFSAWISLLPEKDKKKQNSVLEASLETFAQQADGVLKRDIFHSLCAQRAYEKWSKVKNAAWIPLINTCFFLGRELPQAVVSATDECAWIYEKAKQLTKQGCPEAVQPLTDFHKTVQELPGEIRKSMTDGLKDSNPNFEELAGVLEMYLEGIKLDIKQNIVRQWFLILPLEKQEELQQKIKEINKQSQKLKPQEKNNITREKTFKLAKENGVYEDILRSLSAGIGGEGFALGRFKPTVSSVPSAPVNPTPVSLQKVVEASSDDAPLSPFEINWFQFQADLPDKLREHFSDQVKKNLQSLEAQLAQNKRLNLHLSQELVCGEREALSQWLESNPGARQKLSRAWGKVFPKILLEQHFYAGVLDSLYAFTVREKIQNQETEVQENLILFFQARAWFHCDPAAGPAWLESRPCGRGGACAPFSNKR